METEKKIPKSHCISFLAVVSVTILVVIIISSLLSMHKIFAIVINLGSLSTDIQVFSWPANSKSVKLTYEARIDPITQSHLNHPLKVADKIIDHINRLPYSVIPSDEKSSIPLYVEVTDRLRNLYNVGQKPKVENFLSILRSKLKELDYDLYNYSVQIRVMPAEEEAISLWIAANYLSFTLQKEAKTVGVLQVGEYSIVLAFIPVDGSTNFKDRKPLSLFDRDLYVYRKSYFCLGREDIQKLSFHKLWSDAGSPKKPTLIANPCYPVNFSVALYASEIFESPCINMSKNEKPDRRTLFTFTGRNPSTVKCKQLILDVVKYSGMLQDLGHPPFPRMKFFVISKFHLRVKRQLKERGIQISCEKPLMKIRNKYNKRRLTDKTLTKYCFNAHYILSLMQVLNFSGHDKLEIQYKDHVFGRKISWTMGFIIQELEF